MSRSVEALLVDIRLLGEEQYRIVEKVRALAKQNVHPLSEEIKYGGILFVSGQPFAGVFAYREHVSVEFSQGARIQDTEGLLEGRGKGRRHIKLRSVHDIEARKVSTYLRLALAAAQAGA